MSPPAQDEKRVCLASPKLTRREMMYGTPVLMCSCLSEGMEEEKAGSPVVKEKDLDNIAIQGLRPVRKETSWHRKRQLIMSNEPVGWRKPMRLEGTKEESYRVEDHVVPKSEEERACILQAIKTNFLFEHTTDKQNKVSESKSGSGRSAC